MIGSREEKDDDGKDVTEVVDRTEQDREGRRKEKKKKKIVRNL